MIKHLLILVSLLVSNVVSSQNSNQFSCEIHSSQTKYKLGESPQVNVSISNNSNAKIYLPGSLDDSERKKRYPYCYFTIEKPKTITNIPFEGCGTINPLRKEDFIMIYPGETFNPYKSIDDFGFFGSMDLYNSDHFQFVGIYKITFHYSTEARNIKDYNGISGSDLELDMAFNKMPNIVLVSNTIEVVFK